MILQNKHYNEEEVSIEVYSASNSIHEEDVYGIIEESKFNSYIEEYE